MVKTVLFVCTGNTCRSPMAVGFIKKFAPDKKLKILSAGTSASNGVPPSANAIEVMQEEGIDISEHRSTMLDGYLLDEADIVLVMTEMHRNHIVSWFKSTKEKIRLLREFDDVNDDKDYPNIPDPIGRDIEIYRKCREMIKRSLRGIVKIL